MQKYTPQEFNIGELSGISAKNIEEHLKLYKGYVTNANNVVEKISTLSEGMFKDKEDNGYIIAELFRRLAFEYNGMRNHEVYFNSLSGGPKPLNPNSALAKIINETCISLDILLMGFKNMAMTRGVGWAVLWYDKRDKRLLANWVDEQHLGQLNGCTMLLALDMWEHAYVYDYPTSAKKDYIEAYFTNLNWEVIEENFNKAQ
ncbi:MAG: superoxide dismutase [Minisyncoccia bacterium]